MRGVFRDPCLTTLEHRNYANALSWIQMAISKKELSSALRLCHGHFYTVFPCTAFIFLLPLAIFIWKTRELPGVAPVNCAISHIFAIIQIKLLKQSFLIIYPCMDAPYVWDHISERKACIKNPKTCGPSKWLPLTAGMSYSCGQSVSIEKPHDKQSLQDSHIS